MKTEPTEARDMLSKFAEMRGWNKNKLIGWSEAADFADWFVNQSSPKIKQLDWGFYGTYYSAETPVIDYMTTQENDFSSNNGECTLWVNGFPISHGTLDEAKAAAQADFERRMMECLDL